MSTMFLQLTVKVKKRRYCSSNAKKNQAAFKDNAFMLTRDHLKCSSNMKIKMDKEMMTCQPYTLKENMHVHLCAATDLNWWYSIMKEERKVY